MTSDGTDSSEDLTKQPPPFILSRRDFERILQAAKVTCDCRTISNFSVTINKVPDGIPQNGAHVIQVITPEEREMERKRQEEAHKQMIRESEERRERLEAAALTNPHHRNSPGCGDLNPEEQDRQHHILERAQQFRDEQIPEIKKLNEWIHQAKCHAIRDVQMEEKKKRV